MSTTESLIGIDVDRLLVDRLIRATQIGFEMAGIAPRPVGASRFLHTGRRITALIGLLGENSGTLSLNLSERAARLFAGRLLCEDQAELTQETLDGVGEIANMIAGAGKELLAGSEHAIANITCPTVVIGSSYDLYYSKGFTTVSVDFEVADIPVVQMGDRVFSAGISLVRRSATPR